MACRKRRRQVPVKGAQAPSMCEYVTHPMTVHNNQVEPATAQCDRTASHAATQQQHTRRLSTLFFSPPTAPSLAVHGRYSIERLLALDKYSRTKSHWHILWVIFWTPLVPILIIFVYQLPPLAPPEAGLQANWVFVVVRCGIGIGIICECCLVLVSTVAPELNKVLTRRMGLLWNLWTVVVYMTLVVAFAIGWGFPVPFTPSIINPITAAVSMAALHRVVRPLVKQSHETKRRFMICLLFTVVFSLASVAYPAYMALFFAVDARDPRYQPVVTFLMPLIKLLMRKMMAYTAREMEDLVPVMIIFSVEFFSSLYQVISVQTGSSTATTVTIMALDLGFTIRSQWKLHSRTQSLRQLLKGAQAEALLPALAAVCDDLRSLQASSADELLLLRSIRLYSAVPNDACSPGDLRRLERINKAGVFSSTRLTRHPQQFRQRATIHQRATRFVLPPAGMIGPIITDGSPPAEVGTGKFQTPVITRDQQSAAVIEATAMLFRSELLLLAEYLECIIPLFFAVNIVLQWVSPNAAYDPRIGSIKTTSELLLVLVNIAALFAMEVVSFVLLNWMLHKWLHFSPLHQLGFVLEHQTTFIRANMLFVLVLSLQFNVVHAGTDFSFQFKWLHMHDHAE